MPPDRDGAQHLMLEHGGCEGRGGQVGDAAGDGVADHLLHPLGQVVVVQPQHNAQIRADRPRVQGRLQVDLVTAGHRDQGNAGAEVRRPQRLLPVDLPDDHVHAQPPRERHPGRLRVTVDGHDADAQVVQLADHPHADPAEPDHDHVAAGRRPLFPQRAGQPCADDQGGHERHEYHPVEGQDELCDLLRAAEGGIGDRRAGRVQHGQVQRVRPGVSSGRGQQHKPGDRRGEQGREPEAEPVPDQPPEHLPRGPHRVPPAGQRITRGPVRDGQHEVGVLLVRRQQPWLGGTARGGQPAQHLAWIGVLAPGHVQGAPGHPDVAGSRLS